MIKFSLRKTTVKTQPTERADGYTAYTAKLVTTFQAVVESEIASLPYAEQVTAYEGLRLALLKARSADMRFIGYEQDDMMRLRAILNTTIDADNNFAYSAR